MTVAELIEKFQQPKRLARLKQQMVSACQGHFKFQQPKRLARLKQEGDEPPSGEESVEFQQPKRLARLKLCSRCGQL